MPEGSASIHHEPFFKLLVPDGVWRILNAFWCRATLLLHAFLPKKSLAIAEEETAEQRAARQESERRYRRMLQPHIVTEILRHMSDADRLSMRLVSRATERAVAASDMHVKAGNWHRSAIYISGAYDLFTMYLGFKKPGTITLMKSVLDEDMDMVVRMRDKLFTKVFVAKVYVSEIDFNRVPVSYVERLLNGCIYEEIHFTFKGDEYKSDVLGLLHSIDCTKLHLTFDKVEAGFQTFISFTGPLSYLKICVKGGTRVDIEDHFALLLKRHKLLDVLVHSDERHISEMIRYLEFCNCDQRMILHCVKSKLRAFLWRFGVYLRSGSIMQTRFTEEGLLDQESVYGRCANGRWDRCFVVDFRAVRMRAVWDAQKISYNLELSIRAV